MEIEPHIPRPTPEDIQVCSLIRSVRFSRYGLPRWHEEVITTLAYMRDPER